MGEEARSSFREVIHVAVGTNFVKERPNLLWIMRKFSGAEVVLIHVHVLSKGIPMMGTQILPSIASEYAVKRHRKEERKRMTELMMQYINFCQQKKIQVKAVVIQNKNVSFGLQRLVQKHRIKRLVLGSRSISKEETLFSCCQVWLVCNGKHITTSGAVFNSRDMNLEEEEAKQYWSTLSYVLDSEDCLQFVTPPNNLEDEIVNNEEETQHRTSRWSRCSTEDTMNVESLKQQLDPRELAELGRQNMQEKEETGHALTKMSIVEQQVEQLRQEKSEAMRESITLKTHFHCNEFSASELEKATNNFHPSQKIGEGGYGPVYRGFLGQTAVAIKVLKPESRQGATEFQQEVLVLSKIRHPNVIKLHGVCLETSTLVYEYLPNGNLDERLSGKRTPQLSCLDRFRIISELRSVLLFLHLNQPHAIVHADLKLQNILLDSNNISRLGDFGTARLMLPSGEEDDTIYRRTNPIGTVGYMDPVFLTDGLLTPQTDIYSFGIIILRLLSGLPNPRIREKVEEGLRRGTARQLLHDAAGQWPAVQSEKLMQLALKCCRIERNSRPSLLSEEWKVLETLMAMAGTKSNLRM